MRVSLLLFLLRMIKVLKCHGVYFLNFFTKYFNEKKKITIKNNDKI